MRNPSPCCTCNELSVAIIGAGYAGLSFANVLRLKAKINTQYTIYESMIPPFSFIAGKFEIPSYPIVLSSLNLKNSGLDRKNVFCTLREKVQSKIKYGIKVLSMKRLNVKGGDHFYLYTSDSEGNKAISRGYDFVVGADGVRSICRNGLKGVFLIGDARWVSDRFWDLGFKRIQEGADIAMRDALDLGEYISREGVNQQRLKLFSIKNETVILKFCARSIWIKQMLTRITISFILGILIFHVPNSERFHE